MHLPLLLQVQQQQRPLRNSRRCGRRGRERCAMARRVTRPFRVPRRRGGRSSWIVRIQDQTLQGSRVSEMGRDVELFNSPSFHPIPSPEPSSFASTGRRQQPQVTQAHQHHRRLLPRSHLCSIHLRISLQSQTRPLRGSCPFRFESRIHKCIPRSFAVWYLPGQRTMRY